MEFMIIPLKYLHECESYYYSLLKNIHFGQLIEHWLWFSVHTHEVAHELMVKIIVRFCYSMQLCFIISQQGISLAITMSIQRSFERTKLFRIRICALCGNCLCGELVWRVVFSMTIHIIGNYLVKIALVETLVLLST